MIFGPSSDFISSGSDFIQQNNSPLTVTFRSNGMSRSFYDVMGFQEQRNVFTGMDYWRFNTKGGNDSFVSMQTDVTPGVFNDLNLRSFMAKARSQGAFSVYRNNIAEDITSFLTRVPENDISTIYFGLSRTRPGIHIEPGSDPDDVFELDDRRGVMNIHIDEIYNTSKYFYHFYPDQESFVPAIGYHGIGVRVVKENDLPQDAAFLS